MKNFSFLIFLIFFQIFSNLYGESVSGKVSKGIKQYDAGKYDEALKHFIDAQVEAPEDPLIQYNIANTHYRMKNYEEAIKGYLNSSTKGDLSLEQKSYFNAGNAFYRQGKYQESVEYYKKALDLKPDDQEAKYNLEFAREMIKKMMEEEKKRQEEQNKQNQNQKEQQEKENKQGNEKKGEEKKQEEGKQDQKKPGEENQQAQKQPQENKDKQDKEGDQKSGEQRAAKPLSKEEAESLLNSLDEDQKKLLQKQMQGIGGNYGSSKDW